MSLPKLTDELIAELWFKSGSHLHKFAKMLRDWLGENVEAPPENELYLMDRGCFERGCCCHDDRFDTDGALVWVREVKDGSR